MINLNICIGIYNINYYNRIFINYLYLIFIKFYIIFIIILTLTIINLIFDLNFILDMIWYPINYLFNYIYIIFNNIAEYKKMICYIKYEMNYLKGYKLYIDKNNLLTNKLIENNIDISFFNDIIYLKGKNIKILYCKLWSWYSYNFLYAQILYKRLPDLFPIYLNIFYERLPNLFLNINNIKFYKFDIINTNFNNLSHFIHNEDWLINHEVIYEIIKDKIKYLEKEILDRIDEDLTYISEQIYYDNNQNLIKYNSYFDKKKRNPLSPAIFDFSPITRKDMDIIKRDLYGVNIYDWMEKWNYNIIESELKLSLLKRKWLVEDVTGILKLVNGIVYGNKVDNNFNDINNIDID